MHVPNRSTTGRYTGNAIAERRSEVRMSFTVPMAGSMALSSGLGKRPAPFERAFTARPMMSRNARIAAQRITAQIRPEQKQEGSATSSAAIIGAAGLLAPFFMDVDPAFAGNPLLTGKTVSLIHPAIMLFLFSASSYTAWLGFQWRQTRTLPTQIKELKAELPKPDAEGNRPSSPLDKEISELEQKRKELTKGDFRTKHSNWGHLLLGIGVLIAVEGPVNTYLRAGKLFPGPHLYAGAAIVVLWATAASLVPAMSKGNEAARTAHITLNSLNLLLFAWQVPTGFEIVQKVWENVAWP